MTNQGYINIYNSGDKIITDFYKVKDRLGRQVDVTGVVNPLKIDNRQVCAPIDQQGISPHCASYSACTIVETLYWKRTGKLKQIDAHQVYALAKQLDGNVNDEGTFLEHSLSAVLSLCSKDPEFDFLRDAKINLFYNDGTDNTIELTKQLLHRYDILQSGFNITDAWFNCNARDYVLKHSSRSCGGHAVNIVGYSPEGFYIQNQWGLEFGSKGFAIMPYDIFRQEFMYGAFLSGVKS